jgi:hypothetical protein
MDDTLRAAQLQYLREKNLSQLRNYEQHRARMAPSPPPLRGGGRWAGRHLNFPSRSASRCSTPSTSPSLYRSSMANVSPATARASPASRPARPPSLDMARPIHPQSARDRHDVLNPADASPPRVLFTTAEEKDTSTMSSLQRSPSHDSPVGSARNAARAKRARVTMLHTDPNAMGLSSPYLIQEAHHTFGTIDKDNSGTIDMHELGAVGTSRISHTCRPWLRRTSDPACLHCVACACGRIPPLPLMNHTHLYTHLSCTFCLACRGCVALRYACC